MLVKRVKMTSLQSETEIENLNFGLQTGPSYIRSQMEFANSSKIDMRLEDLIEDLKDWKASFRDQQKWIKESEDQFAKVLEKLATERKERAKENEEQFTREREERNDRFRKVKDQIAEALAIERKKQEAIRAGALKAGKEYKSVAFFSPSEEKANNNHVEHKAAILIQQDRKPDEPTLAHGNDVMPDQIFLAAKDRNKVCELNENKVEFSNSETEVTTNEKENAVKSVCVVNGGIVEKSVENLFQSDVSLLIKVLSYEKEFDFFIGCDETNHTHTQPEVVPLDQPPGCVFEVDRTQACRA